MLVRAREAAAEQEVKNVTWGLGADTDIPAVASMLGGNQVGSVTVGQALHWMRYRELFHALIPVPPRRRDRHRHQRHAHVTAGQFVVTGAARLS
jgi:hypothetical protein